MIDPARHLPEDRLVDCYVAAQGGESADPPTDEHLHRCTECAARYAEIARFMDLMRAEAEAEADAVFTTERLRHQQQQIARRIEHLGRAARIIAFPGRFVSGHIERSSRIATRWVAAAAAAGLFVGVVAGMFLHVESRHRAVVKSGVAGSSRMTPVASLVPLNSNHADEDFLFELEIAGNRPHTRVLQPFDALTPHVRDVRDFR